MTWNAKTVVRYLLFFCLFVGIGVILNLFSGEPIDWGSALFLGAVLTVGWIGIDVLSLRRMEKVKEARRREEKRMSKAEKRAFAEAEAARQRREKEAAEAAEAEAAGNAAGSKGKK